MKNISVSVIIVNWNTADLLIQCIYSLIKTTKQYSIEIIVCDNGSHDNSVDLVKTIFPFVIVIENGTNLGFAKANNIGINHAKGDYICLVNSDIIALNGAMDNLITYFSQHVDIGAIGPLTYDQHFLFRPNCRRSPSLITLFSDSFGLHRILPMPFKGRIIDDISKTTPSIVDVLSGCFFLTSRQVISKVGLLDEEYFIYGEDKDWCKRISSAGYKICFFPISKVIHIAGASSSKAPIQFKKELVRSEYTYWKKHESVFRRTLFHCIKISHYASRLFLYTVLSILDKHTYFGNWKEQRDLIRFVLCGS